ncbi:MAG: RHS repeat-associated core domain-containing protein, partial [Parasphingopyxis sp.]|uniref:RHS repeat-associated core domain-containing protein n=1 Tax=Parasphingopyxis sp. TaxID=1920299 RepID=UPI003F9F720E
RYLYDGDELAVEYNSAGTAILRRYVHGAGVDDPQAARAFAAPPAPRSRSRYEGSGTSSPRFLHADERGSIVAVSDSGGTVTDINTYDTWGVPAPDNIGRFQYTGQIWLPQMQLYQYKARMYAPHMGRFMQTDPIGYEDGMNLYTYVGNDPVNGADPTGLIACEDRTFCSSASFGYSFSSRQQDALRALGGQQSGIRGPLTFTDEGNSGGGGSGSFITIPADEPLEEDFVTTGVVTAVAGAIASGIRWGLGRLGIRSTASGVAPDSAALLSRAILPSGALNTSRTVAAQLAGQRSYIPVQAITQALSAGVRRPDPQGVANQFMYTITAGRTFLNSVGQRRWSSGTLEVLINERTGQIVHVLYRSTARGFAN